MSEQSKVRDAERVEVERPKFKGGYVGFMWVYGEWLMTSLVELQPQNCKIVFRLPPDDEKHTVRESGIMDCPNCGGYSFAWDGRISQYACASAGCGYSSTRRHRTSPHPFSNESKAMSLGDEKAADQPRRKTMPARVVRVCEDCGTGYEAENELQRFCDGCCGNH